VRPKGSRLPSRTQRKSHRRPHQGATNCVLVAGAAFAPKTNQSAQWRLVEEVYFDKSWQLHDIELQPDGTGSRALQ